MTTLELSVKARSFDEALDLVRNALRQTDEDETPKTGSWSLELSRVTLPDVTDGIARLQWLFKAHSVL